MKTKETSMIRALFLLAVCLAPGSLLAQTDRSATLLVTVVDETRGVLPGATVTIAGTDAANKADTIAPATASDRGQVTFEKLAPGRYSIKAEFSGFQTRVLTDVRVRSGENKQVVVLPIDRVQSSVTVERDRQAAAADRDITFGSVLTREQIDALSDDPDELRRQLMDLGGPNAKIIVDSFEGRELPPKAMIKSIRISRDQFAPEAHWAGEFRIEILTQPGIGPVRGNVRMGFYDSATDGKNPIVGQRGPAQSVNYGFGLNGTLINERASFNFNINGTDSYSTAVLNAQTSGGLVRSNAPVRSPSDNMFFGGGIDYALTKDQVVRVAFHGMKFSRTNAGIGSFNLLDRAYSSEDRNFSIFMQQNGPIGRRFVLNTRLSINAGDSTSKSVIEAPTVVVNDWFTIGGAQQRGGTHSRNYWFNSDLDYVRGIHSMRAGIQLEYSTYRTDSESNYLGTFVFENLDAYEAGRPRSFSRRIGNPRLDYRNAQLGLYIQDDIKVRKNLTITGGVRYEAQTHVPDVLNFAPRIGFTWAPFKSGKTTLRGSWGIFYDWLSTGIYQQTLQIDGFRQQELNIMNPFFPDPGSVGASAPMNRYLLADDRPMAYAQRLSAGIAQTLSRRISANVLYSYGYRYSLLVGRNLNAPINGLRPDPTFANIVEVVSDASQRQHTLTAAPNVNNFDGPFGLPATGSLDEEWGPANQDTVHRFTVGIGSSAIRNLSLNLKVNGASGTPYSIRTGLDDNGDLVFNDRPAGVARNSERTAMQWMLNANVNYSIGFGRGGGGGPPIVGIFIAAPGGAPTVMTGSAPPTRYRLGFFVQMTNLTNHANYAGYSGTLTSPFFGRPTTVLNPRKIDFGVNFGF